jgi:hypothetical protein
MGRLICHINQKWESHSLSNAIKLGCLLNNKTKYISFGG